MDVDDPFRKGLDESGGEHHHKACKGYDIRIRVADSAENPQFEIAQGGIVSTQDNSGRNTVFASDLQTAGIGRIGEDRSDTVSLSLLD